MNANVLLVASVALVLGAAAWWLLRDRGEPAPISPAQAPAWISETGLFPRGRPDDVDVSCLPFSPQYPLWSDGTEKRRWVRLPKGAVIDASAVDTWAFPVGTQFWKEFSIDGVRIETRFMERVSESEWRFATYRWLENQSDAALVGRRGMPAVATSKGGTPYDLPSVADCKACHEAARVPVLGFGALQLSGERDPGALHASPRQAQELDLASLEARGMLRGLPPRWKAEAPRILARDENERAALGYLHANCAHCHRQDDVIPDVDLDLEQRVGDSVERVLRSMLAQAHKRLPGEAVGRPRIVPGQPDAGLLLARLATRDPSLQMPPIATRWSDEKALKLLQHWVKTMHPIALETRQ